MRLEEVCTVFTDGDWIESKDQSDEGIRLVQTGNIGIGMYLEKESRAKYISQDTFSKLKCTEIFSGDILVSRLPEPVGRACIIPEKEERMITAVDCTICRPNESIVDKEYLCYFMRSNAYYNRLLGSVTGTTRKRISRKNLGNVELHIPSKDVQRNVVEKLNCLVKVLNSRKEELVLLDNLIKARFVELFGDPVTNTLNWEKVTVGDICFVTKLAGFEYTDHIKYKDSGDVIMIRGLNVKDKKLKLDEIYYIDAEVSDKLPRSQLNPNDVVMTYVGVNIGDVALVDDKYRYHLAPNVAKISPFTFDALNPLFFVNLLAFNKDNFASNATNTAKQALNMEKIRNLPVMMPPLELQEQFAAFVEQVDKSKFVYTYPKTAFLP